MLLVPFARTNSSLCIFYLAVWSTFMLLYSPHLALFGVDQFPPLVFQVNLPHDQDLTEGTSHEFNRFIFCSEKSLIDWSLKVQYDTECRI